METTTPKQKPGRIDLKAAIKNAHPTPQGTLEQIEAKTGQKKGRNAPRKDPKDKIVQDRKIVVGFTQSELDALDALALDLSSETLDGKAPALSLVVKTATLDYLKKYKKIK
jgi:hypothetical protein